MAKLFIICVQRSIMVEEELMQDTSFMRPGIASSKVKDQPVIVNNYYQSNEEKQSVASDRRPSEIELEELKSHLSKSHNGMKAHTNKEMAELFDKFGKSHTDTKKHTAAELNALKEHFKETQEVSIAGLKETQESTKSAIAGTHDSLRQTLIGANESSREHTKQELAILKEEILAGTADSTMAFKAHTTLELSVLAEELKMLKNLVGNLTNAVAAGFEKHTLISIDVKESQAAAAAELNKVQPTMHQMLEAVNGAITQQNAASEKMAADLKDIEDAAVSSMKSQQVELHRDMVDTMAKQQLILRKDISKWSNSVVKQQHVVTDTMKAQQVSLHNDMIKILTQNQSALHNDLTESLSEQQKEVAESMVKHQTYLHDEMASQADRQHADMADSILNQEKMADQISKRLDYIQWIKDDEGEAPPHQFQKTGP